MQAGVCVGYNVDDFYFQSTRSGEQKLQLFQQESKRSLGVRELVYLEELELERERWRLRPGDLERERRRAGDRLLGERDLQEHTSF